MSAGTSVGADPDRGAATATMRAGVSIREASKADSDGIWDVMRPVIATGDTWLFDPHTTRDDALAYWFRPEHRVYVAELDGRIVGSYELRTNQPDLGDHVSNAGFMVAPDTRGLGVGQAMGRHAIAEAKRLGYRAMQFNFVVSTNERAVKLWQALGFRIVGTLPQAYRHARLGYVDAYVMHRFLDDAGGGSAAAK